MGWIENCYSEWNLSSCSCQYSSHYTNNYSPEIHRSSLHGTPFLPEDCGRGGCREQRDRDDLVRFARGGAGLLTWLNLSLKIFEGRFKICGGETVEVITWERTWLQDKSFWCWSKNSRRSWMFVMGYKVDFNKNNFPLLQWVIMLR